MKKKTFAVVMALVLVLAIGIGATMAYLTSTDSAKNTFTVGNVKIDLIESRYHRAGSNGSSDTSIPSPTTVAQGVPYVTDGTKIFTDEEIQEDAKTYAEYFAERSENMVPGVDVVKCPYVVNTGKNDAYIRIRMLLPQDDGLDGMWTATAMTSGEFIPLSETYSVYPYAMNYDVEYEGKTYDEFVFLRTEPLAPGEMTTWSVWNYFGIADDATSDTLAGLETFDVIVFADAIQATGFDNAVDAFVAFDAQTK